MQVRQQAVTAGYERAVTADETAEEAYRAAVARAERERAAVRRARVVALAGLAATVRDQEACAAIADVPVGDVRHAAREATAEEVEQFLSGISAPAPRSRADRGAAASGPAREHVGAPSPAPGAPGADSR
jgi:hydroxypyruvate isomerase